MKELSPQLDRDLAESAPLTRPAFVHVLPEEAILRQDEFAALVAWSVKTGGTPEEMLRTFGTAGLRNHMKRGGR